MKTAIIHKRINELVVQITSLENPKIIPGPVTPGSKFQLIYTYSVKPSTTPKLYIYSLKYRGAVTTKNVK